MGFSGVKWFVVEKKKRETVPELDGHSHSIADRPAGTTSAPDIPHTFAHAGIGGTGAWPLRCYGDIFIFIFIFLQEWVGGVCRIGLFTNGV